MTYEEALNYLHSAPRFKGKAALQRMERLCAVLGDPQKRFPAVHVAGTNGKGSTVRMTAAALTASGYRAGMYVSPYVRDFRERIQIGGEMISREDLCRAAEQVREADGVLRREGLEPTEFELVTACGFLHFARERCDIVVLEVGLGGRFDATNVIPPPQAAAITRIALDHTEILGDSLRKIAFEKCGILKPGTQAVSFPNQYPAALERIRERCRELAVPLTVPDWDHTEILQADLEGCRFRYSGEEYALSMGGRHQISNALTALSLLDCLRNRGYHLPHEAIREGLAKAQMPGRLQFFPGRPPVIVDGAHNPDGMEALLDSIGDRPFQAIFTAMRDKDYHGALRMLGHKADRIFCCGMPDYPRAERPEILAAAEAGCPVSVAADFPEALEMAKAFSIEKLVVVCGSLFLAGKAIETLSARTPDGK